MDLRYRLNNSEVVDTYNKWFIKLRFLAFAALVVFIIASLFIKISFSTFQTTFLISIAVFILIYNSLLLFVHNKKSTEPHNFAIVQVTLDLISLLTLTYITGGVTSPFIFFFIFHIIIGSLLFHRSVVYSIVGLLVTIILSFTLLEYYEIIPHQVIKGWITIGAHDDVIIVLAIILVFSFTLISSVIIASKISSDLYAREEQLKNALIEIEQNEETKQKYIAGVVHELKSPIAAVSSMLGLVSGGYSGDVSEEALEKISRSEERLAQAIQSINKVLRISQFKLNNEINTDSVNIKNIVAKVIDDNKEICVRKEIEVGLDISQGYESKIIGDPVLLEMAFSNIFGNAIKYNKRKGRIIIELISNNKKSIIKISDTGIGIPSNELSNITKDYYRASNARSSGIEGTGTGLNFVKSIVEAHKGKMKIKSPSSIGNTLNKGTAVVIALPRR